MSKKTYVIGFLITIKKKNSLVQLTHILTQYYDRLRGWSVPGNKIINLTKKKKRNNKKLYF